VGTNVFGVLGAFGLVLVSALAISWSIVLVSMIVASPEKVQIFGFIVLFPLTFTSNAFVPTASMPGWLQAWSNVNPVTILSDAIRGLLVSGPVAAPALQSLLWALGFTVISLRCRFARSNAAPYNAAPDNGRARQHSNEHTAARRSQFPRKGPDPSTIRSLSLVRRPARPATR